MTDANGLVQSLKRARRLKFWVQVEEILYCPSNENKGADQLCSYCTADMGLCFRIGQNQFSHDVAHIIQSSIAEKYKNIWAKQRELCNCLKKELSISQQ